MLVQAFDNLQDALGYRWREPKLLKLAVLHGSASDAANNCLSWLGDAVLYMIVTGAAPLATWLFLLHLAGGAQGSKQQCSSANAGGACWGHVSFIQAVCRAPDAGISCPHAVRAEPSTSASHLPVSPGQVGPAVAALRCTCSSLRLQRTPSMLLLPSS